MTERHIAVERLKTLVELIRTTRNHALRDECLREYYTIARQYKIGDIRADRYGVALTQMEKEHMYDIIKGGPTWIKQ